MNNRFLLSTEHVFRTKNVENPVKTAILQGKLKNFYLTKRGQANIIKKIGH